MVASYPTETLVGAHLVADPIVAATRAAFENLIHIPVTEAPARVRIGEQDLPSSEYLIGVVRLDGRRSGSLAICAPHAVARNLAARLGRMRDATYRMAPEDVGDGFGEIINLIAGFAKPELVKIFRAELAMTIPNVFAPEGDEFHPAAPAVLVVPFTCADGDFAVEIAFDNLVAGRYSLASPAAKT